MNRRALRYTAMGITGIFIGSTIEECLEPLHLMPHAEQEDFSPLPFEQQFKWVASGSSTAANSFVSTPLTSRFTLSSFAMNSFVPNLMRGPHDDI